MLKDDQVTKTLKQIFLTGRSGVLVCETAKVGRSLFFESGHAVGAKSSLEADRLGNVMVRQGRITPQQLEIAAEFIRSGLRLGQILVQLGVLKEVEIDRYVRLQVLHIACSMLLAPPLRLVFSDQVAVEALTLTPVAVADIILEAARRRRQIQPYRDVLLNEDRRLGFPSDPRLRLQPVSLSPEEAFILSRIDGSETPRATLSTSPLPEEQTIRTLIGLLQAGIIELQERPSGRKAPKAPSLAKAPKRTVAGQAFRQEVDRLFDLYKRRNHWELLDLRQGASLEEIRHAYHEKSARYHPDRYAHIDDPDLHEKLSFLLTRLNEAFATLSKRPEAQRYQQLVSKETQYEEQKKAWAPPAEVKTTKPSYRRKDRNEARRLFLRAKKAYAKRDYWKTIQLCRHAIELGENEPDHFHLLGLALAHNPKWRIDAEQNLKIASNLQPWQAKHFVALGELYEREGLHIRARKMFEHARAIDPSCPLPSSDS